MVQVKEHSTSEYKTLLQKIGNCFAQVNSEYIHAQTQNAGLREAWFAYGIVKILLQNANLLSYSSLRAKQDLVDSIELHSKKYLEIFQTEEIARETALIFQTNLTNLTSHCNNSKQPTNHLLTAQEFDVIRDLVTDLLQKCQSLFAEQAFNQETIDKLQASAIVFNIIELPIKQQFQLLDKLLLTKELWQIEDYTKNADIDPKHEFNINPHATIEQISATDSDSAFEQLMEIFTNKHHALQNLSNERLIDLYDRLKNFEPQTPILNNVLQKLHHEAQFRYGFSRLSDSGYELLKRFQSYDAISHQIEIAEFAIAEAYLLKKNTFLQEVINTISKHVDNIKAVGAAKNPDVKSVITKLNQQLENLHLKGQTQASTLSLITSKLASGIDAHIYKRYAELDKFATGSLRNKYENLFFNLNQLLDENKQAHNFLQHSIVRKLAQDYHISNLTGSYSKLKTIAAERAEIAKLLAQIDFVETFDKEHVNTIHSLNLRKNVKDSNPVTPIDYVHSVIKALVSQSSAAQLESLYRPLKNNLNQVHNILKQEIVKQIKQRTTITKMLYSIFTGKKKEFDKLKTINKSIEVTMSNNSEVQGFEKMKKTPAEAKKQMESLARKNAENEGMINKVKIVDTNTETLHS